jgi:hypothetical protein
LVSATSGEANRGGLVRALVSWEWQDIYVLLCANGGEKFCLSLQLHMPCLLSESSHIGGGWPVAGGVAGHVTAEAGLKLI